MSAQYPDRLPPGASLVPVERIYWDERYPANEADPAPRWDLGFYDDDAEWWWSHASAENHREWLELVPSGVVVVARPTPVERCLPGERPADLDR